MNGFDKCFDEKSIDGICAVVFLPADFEFNDKIKESYVFVYLNDTPSGKTKCWFCVRKNSVPAKGRVIFKVPDIMAGKVIGYSGVNIRKVAKALGGRYITVQKV